MLALLHLAFKLPLPEVTLSRKEAIAARTLVIAALVVNYAFVVMKAKFPEWL